MTCPKCQSQNAEPFERWTISGRKITIPLLRMWACPNPDCRHQWARESPARPDLPTQEVAYDPSNGSFGVSPLTRSGEGT